LSIRRRYSIKDRSQTILSSARVHRAHGRQKLAAEYFQRFPKERYQTEIESWRELQSQNIEFTMKRLREPIDGAG